MLHTGYDSILDMYRGNVPLAFMRALAFKESTLNPDILNVDSNAVGLFQITKPALKNYNQANNVSLTMSDLKNAQLNARVAGWFLNNVIEHWRKIPALKPDWDSPRFPALLAFGYNSGWSESGGLAKVAKVIEESGHPVNKTDVDMIKFVAPIVPGVSKYLIDDKRAAWSKEVANVFLNRKAIAKNQVAPHDSKASGWLIALGLGVGGMLLMHKQRKG